MTSLGCLFFNVKCDVVEVDDSMDTRESESVVKRGWR